MDRIPLEQRFQMADSHNSEFLGVFNMNFSDYHGVLHNISSMLEVDYMQEAVNAYFDDQDDRNIMIIINTALEFPEEEHKHLLYKLLVLPFVEIDEDSWDYYHEWEEKR